MNVWFALIVIMVFAMSVVAVCLSVINFTSVDSGNFESLTVGNPSYTFPRSRAVAKGFTLTSTDSNGNVDWIKPSIRLPGQVIWRPGGSDSATQNIVNSWEQVVALILATDGALNILVDDGVANCVATTSVDCQTRVRFSSARFNILNPVNFYLQTGVSLQNPLGFYGSLRVYFTGHNVMISNGGVLQIGEGAALSNDPNVNSVVAGIYIADGTQCVISFNQGASPIYGSGEPAIIEVGPSATLILALLQSTVAAQMPNDWISSTTNQATLIVVTDSDGKIFTFAQFTGNLIQQSFSNAILVNYDDSSGISIGNNVQAALTSLKTLLPSFSGTANQTVKINNSGNGFSTIVPIQGSITFLADGNEGNFDLVDPGTVYFMQGPATWDFSKVINVQAGSGLNLRQASAQTREVMVIVTMSIRTLLTAPGGLVNVSFIDFADPASLVGTGLATFNVDDASTRNVSFTTTVTWAPLQEFAIAVTSNAVSTVAVSNATISFLGF